MVRKVLLDGNEAAAHIAYRLSDVIAIYPITPSSPMGEWADQWASEQLPNLWGTVPSVTEMQSEAGAAATIHGALQTGALAATFTASQGLLLMLPNMFKIAGELTATVFHVSARTVATHALSIFGDQGDVMAARTTGFAMLASGSVQEVMDLALVAHAASLESRVPFLHFFDGFRTSHEVMKIDQVADEHILAMIDERLVREHRARALNPDRPVLRGSAQNPDVFFQAREAVNRFYLACPQIVQRTMDRFGELTGRRYRLFDYFGSPDAQRVIVMMGSGAETVHETVEHLMKAGERVGLLRVRLYRPFDAAAFVAALPKSAKVVAVLDRTKEPGASGEPLYQDVLTSLLEQQVAGRGFTVLPRVIGGRYGLSSKEFTPAMAKGVFDEMKKPDPGNHFTVGIEDDVTHTSVAYDPALDIEADDVFRGLFFGLGADGTVGANKNTVKIIGEETEQFAQGYFVYDSKKSGSVTISHLRFSKRPIRSTYLIRRANFVACHQQTFIDRIEMLEQAAPGGTFLLNTQASAGDVWGTLPREVRRELLNKRLRFYVIDAYKVARDSGLGGRINSIMQTCFFAISGLLPREEAVARIKDAIRKTYGSKGEAVVAKNCAAVDRTLENLFEVPLPSSAGNGRVRPPVVPAEAPAMVRDVLGEIIAGRGDGLPVSAMPVDGTFPTATARWEKRNIALEIPVWDGDVCIQCNKCALVCPHAAIRPKVYPPEHLAGAPPTYKSVEARGGEFKGLRYTLQVAPEDCTGCGLCVEFCPAKNKRQTALKAINMAPQPPLRPAEQENYRFFLDIPDFDRAALKLGSVKGSQFLLPLFEYSGACAGCGETPYLKLMSQLFGDRAVIANATGCSSIYGGNLPTTPWAQNAAGRGPTWSNSLFEDAAEFGLGFRLAIDKQQEFAAHLLDRLRGTLNAELVAAILGADQSDEAGIAAQRARVEQLKAALADAETLEARNLLSVADSLVRRSVWIVGGDGWAYDIGYGGLDHVLASGHDVNVLVLDTEVYSNTGGQMSKATPRGAVAKFAAGGKPADKKDLGLMAMAYGNVYVASVAMGANDNHTVQAFAEAESFPGPSLIIAYSHCIAHGINMRLGLNQQKLAVDCGHWMLYRYDPRRAARGENPLELDSHAPKVPLEKYAESENRFQMLLKSEPERARRLLLDAQQTAVRRYSEYARRAGQTPPG
ncbi:MAG: pyruvate:ferredoxin (flavodoxin) oxidoreductase [Planctomycetes bacterium]|nr:pyruvate:ferredoxin (flavodoxin) oxidoreductase [Planctomycetota bacterium]